MRFNRAIALLLLAILPAQSAELPELGEAARAGFSAAQEARLGQEIMRQIRGSRGYAEDPEVSEYLNSLGARLAASSADPHQDFEFFLVQDGTINAFALPGGYVGVHTGLISASRNESELAGVLAHEIAHVTQHHIARMVDAQKTSTLYTLAALAVAILAARSDGQMSQAAIAIGQGMALQSQLNFSRENEREADRIGLQTLYDAGYSANGMASFFERLQAHGRLYENNAPAYLRTHPLTYERMADLQNRVGETPLRQPADSLEYRLVRARVWAAQGEAKDALGRFQTLVQDAGNDASAWYGLGRAALRDGRTGEAERALQQLERLHATSPMVDILAADTAVASGRYDAARQRLERSIRRYTAYRPLAYALARVLLQNRQYAEALAFADRQLRTWPDEPQLHALKAEAHTGLGQRFDAYRAQAEAYVRMHAISAAIDQLQQALRSGEKDFYRLSAAEARLRVLQEQAQQDEREGKDGRR